MICHTFASDDDAEDDADDADDAGGNADNDYNHDDDHDNDAIIKIYLRLTVLWFMSS